MATATIHSDFGAQENKIYHCFHFLPAILTSNTSFDFSGFPGGSEGKVSACSAGDPGSIPGSGRCPGEGIGNPLQYLPGESHGQRNLVGYSPQGRQESDTTE